jgi:hypothetical protein
MSGYWETDLITQTWHSFNKTSELQDECMDHTQLIHVYHVHETFVYLQMIDEKPNTCTFSLFTHHHDQANFI